MDVTDRDDRWFERGMKEAIDVKLERPSVNSEGDLRNELSAKIYAVLKSSLRKIYSLFTSYLM